VLGLPWASGTFQALALLALVVGVVVFVLHMHRGATHIHPLPQAAVLETKEARHDMGDLYQDEQVGDRLRKRLDVLRDEARHLEDNPQHASELMEQLRRVLPAEGWLTERLAQLRARIHLIREGHIHRLEELKQFMATLSPAARKALAAELMSGYQAVVGMDDRLERLDGAVAETERRIRDVTAQAREALARYDYARLYDLVDKAEKLQKHNDKLLRVIERTERKLTGLVETIAKRAAQMSQG
jgi:DNA repair exonuclease SbcCD ATPase subunit